MQDPMAGSGSGDCRVNAVSVGELFSLYERAGFLYFSKMRALEPVLPLIRENWRKALSGGERAMMVFTHHDAHGAPTSSITTWRSSGGGWVSQHLVSVSRSPLATRSILLAAQATKIQRGSDDSQQNWFRPENRFPARVFGSVTSSLGPQCASVRPFALLSAPRKIIASDPPPGVRIVEYRPSHASALLALSQSAEGPTFTRAEALASDPELSQAGEEYRALGLRRFRAIRLAFLPGRDLPSAAVLAYRGPLGLNFSFLENRCHLIIAADCPPALVTTLIEGLLASAASSYEDFELDSIPVVVPSCRLASARMAGLEFQRYYHQSIWLREGFPAWYRHVDRFYSRILSRGGDKTHPEGDR